MALSDVEGRGKFVLARGLSGLQKHQSGYNEARITASRPSDKKPQQNVIDVRVTTFPVLAKAANLSHKIDFMSIDVEGAEMAVLRSIDFEKFHIGALAVENNEMSPEICEFLQSKGYRCLGQLHMLDELFVTAT